MLVRNTAQTHLVDGDQRTVELTFSQVGPGVLEAALPASGNVLPPGPYMLFINKRSAAGPIPSVSRRSSSCQRPDHGNCSVDLPASRSGSSLPFGLPCAGPPVGAHSEVPGTRSVFEGADPPLPSGVIAQVVVSAVRSARGRESDAGSSGGARRVGRPFIRIGPDGAFGDFATVAWRQSTQPEAGPAPAEPEGEARWTKVSESAFVGLVRAPLAPNVGHRSEGEAWLDRRARTMAGPVLDRRPHACPAGPARVHPAGRVGRARDRRRRLCLGSSGERGPGAAARPVRRCPRSALGFVGAGGPRRAGRADDSLRSHKCRGKPGEPDVRGDCGSRSSRRWWSRRARSAAAVEADRDCCGSRMVGASRREPAELGADVLSSSERLVLRGMGGAIRAQR